MEGAMFDFLQSGDGAGAVEDINDQLKTAVVDGNLEGLPALYMQRAVWRLHLGLPVNAEGDLVAAQRCALSDEARTELQLLLVQCYRMLGRPEDESKATDALRSSVQAGSVSSPVLMQQLLSCLHSKGSETNGKSHSNHESTTSRSMDREGSKPQQERKKGGMMSGFLSAPSSSAAPKAAKKVSAAAVEQAVPKSTPAAAVPAPAQAPVASATLETSSRSSASADNSARRKATKTSVYGKTTIEEEVDDDEGDDEEIVTKGTCVEPESSTRSTNGGVSQLNEVLSREPKYLTSMSHEEQSKLAEVMGAAGATGRHISGHEHLQIVERNETVSKCILQINSGKFQEADAQLSAILKKEPTCYQALVARGTCRALAGSTNPVELKKADSDFSKALVQMPLLADVWKRRSQARAALGNTDDAAKDLEECLAKCVFESKEAWLEVLHDLGSMFQKKRNFVKGRKVFKRYMTAAPKGSVTKELLSMVGLSCTAMGDISEGLDHYRSAIAMDPEYKEAWLNLFQGLKECGKVSDAEKAFAHLQRLDAKGKTRSMIAYRFRAHMQQCCGQHAGGIDTLTKALSPLNGKNPSEQRIECLYLRGACNHALGRLALAYSDYDSAFGEAVSHHVPQETLNFRAVAYYQGEICVYLNSKIDADVLHFSIDRDLDPEFKECWAKQMLPTPKLLARCPRQLKRGQKFPPNRKDPALPSDAALASLLPIADHIGTRLQYSHQGFMNNGRQQRAAGLAAIELTQRFLTELDARRNGSHTWVSSEGASAQDDPDGRHAFSWRDAMDTVVRWRQIGEPNDQVLWVDRLTPEEFRNGFGSHTPMFSGQTKCVRYYMNCTRALKLFASIIQKQGYVVNADNEQVTLSDKQLKAVANATSPEAMFAAMGVDCWVVVPIASTSRKEIGHNLEGTRLTITRSRDQADAYEFSIRTPVTPARWEDFDKELAHGFEAICSAAISDNKPVAADAILRYVYYWYNFMPLARGSAAVGYTTILSLFWALGMPVSVDIPQDYQPDWEAILCQDPDDFVKELRKWLTPPEASVGGKDGNRVDAVVAVYCDPRATDSFPDVMGTLGTLRRRFYALNHGTDAEKLCVAKTVSSGGGGGSSNGSTRRRA